MTLHLLPIYLGGLSRWLNLLVLLLATSRQADRLTVTRSSRPVFLWWLRFLILTILNIMCKGNLNRKKRCDIRWILWKIIRLGIYILDRPKIILSSVDEYIKPNSPPTVLLSVTRLVWTWKDSMTKKVSTTLRPLPLLQRWA